MGPGPASVRQRVYDAVRRFPGIHLRAIERQLGESAALVGYHLDKLVADAFVEVHEQGGYSRYFPTSKGRVARVSARDQAWLGLLREEVPLHIVLVLLDEGPQAHSAIVERVGVAKSTVSYHLAKLAQAAIVEREGRLVRLADRERAYKLLLAYKPTPGMLEAFADLWENLYG